MQNTWTFLIKFSLLFYVNFSYEKICSSRVLYLQYMQQNRHHEPAKLSLSSNDTEAYNLTASYNLMSYQFLDTFICNLVSPPTWPLVTPGDPWWRESPVGRWLVYVRLWTSTSGNTTLCLRVRIGKGSCSRLFIRANCFL